MKNIGIERLYEIHLILHDIIVKIHDFEIFEEIEMYELLLIELDFIIVEVEIEFTYELIDVTII